MLACFRKFPVATVTIGQYSNEYSYWSGLVQVKPQREGDQLHDSGPWEGEKSPSESFAARSVLKAHEVGRAPTDEALKEWNCLPDKRLAVPGVQERGLR